MEESEDVVGSTYLETERMRDGVEAELSNCGSAQISPYRFQFLCFSLWFICHS